MACSYLKWRCWSSHYRKSKYRCGKFFSISYFWWNEKQNYDAESLIINIDKEFWCESETPCFFWRQQFIIYIVTLTILTVFFLDCYYHWIAMLLTSIQKSRNKSFTKHLLLSEAFISRNGCRYSHSWQAGWKPSRTYYVDHGDCLKKMAHGNPIQKAVPCWSGRQEERSGETNGRTLATSILS